MRALITTNTTVLVLTILQLVSSLLPCFPKTSCFVRLLNIFPYSRLHTGPCLNLGSNKQHISPKTPYMIPYRASLCGKERNIAADER